MDELIAITGIGCRFPGGVTNPAAFWNLLLQKRETVAPVPPLRWDIRRFYDPLRTKPCKSYVRSGHFLDGDVFGFDPEAFGLSPREAAAMDPQQRLLLELAWEAFEDAGQVPDALRGLPVGVYVGAFNLDYLILQNRPANLEVLTQHSAQGGTMGMLANRISHVFDFRGPSLSIDTACSSSLVALHYACQDLRSGVCRQAVVCGVNLMLLPETVVAMAKGQFLASDGRSKAFDRRADGYGRGEGGAVLLLKPLSAALADGDDIYAVIRASGLNQDGHTDGISQPSYDAQLALLRAVYGTAGIAPADVGYVEAHGTGTQAGDITEMRALAAWFGRNAAVDGPLPVGSVKTNIGHLEAAAGVAAVVKVALALKAGLIPPGRFPCDPNPAIGLDGSGLVHATETMPWPNGPGAARLAGINGFGYGGTNAHVVLQRAEPLAAPETYRTAPPRRSQVLVLSAETRQSLSDSQASCAARLAGDDVPLADLCHTAALRRRHRPFRLAVVGSSAAEIADKLKRHADGGRTADVVVGNPGGNPGAHRRLAFVYTGMGPQWWGMAHDLYRDQPVFR
ncbi:MAG TPA: beta-ketoacyl synthase N-terminal-like domain-containing protein, partial [Azospirillaceae bacterium]|nr:beta-ketoacyl synthase N-terminal-like domain-containing protein [Azospirillaceae bacterium]